MRKLFIILSLVLYIFGSSYAVHATTMILPYMQNNAIEMTTCHNNFDDMPVTERENSSCLDRCVGIYGEISVNTEFENLKTTNFSCEAIVFDYNIGNYISDIDTKLIKHKIPPDKNVLYPGYIGKITILVI